MSRASRARRIAAAAAYGGGGVGALGIVGGAALYGLIIGETKLARRRIPAAATEPPFVHDTVWAAAGVSARRPPIRMAMLGDSTAAGYGVHHDRDTPGAQLAIAVSAIARRPVHVTSVAVVGAESNTLPAQVANVDPRVELAVIIVGANDVTHRIKPAESVRYLGDAVRALRANGTRVVVGTCPDLGTIRPLAQPLRYIARRLSRQLAAAQTISVVEAGGRTVSLGDLLGPLFAQSVEMFSEDQFHPSATGYAHAADALLPSALDALGLRTRSRSASAFTTRRARPVAKAAVQAVAHPGTEVAGVEVHGETEGRRGRWARLRRRRPQHPVPTAREQARPVQDSVHVA
ncbi:MAG TPA: SGNH/GDSL hydrolase family protein [Jatrophihabitantaceae bacterium]|nr:SGNH/GDSL hydrolase family protein [Jatrophihabitantaceae bacterium]